MGVPGLSLSAARRPRSKRVTVDVRPLEYATGVQWSRLPDGCWLQQTVTASEGLQDESAHAIRRVSETTELGEAREAQPFCRNSAASTERRHRAGTLRGGVASRGSKSLGFASRHFRESRGLPPPALRATMARRFSASVGSGELPRRQIKG